MATIAVTDFSADDVHLNLALEELLLTEVSEGHLPPLVRIWHNPESVIMGISRSINLDLYIENILEDKIELARRASGGGTVYHDSGTVSFSFFFPWNLLGYDIDPKKVNDSTINPFLDIVINALKATGLNAYKSGISDIFINGRKISGNAQKRVRGAILHHGTILCDMNLNRMERYLKVPPERSGIPHSQFVTSLLEQSISIDQQKLSELLTKSITSIGHDVIPMDLEKTRNDLLEKSSELAEKNYRTREWIYRR